MDAELNRGRCEPGIMQIPDGGSWHQHVGGRGGEPWKRRAVVLHALPSSEIAAARGDALLWRDSSGRRAEGPSDRRSSKLVSTAARDDGEGSGSRSVVKAVLVAARRDTI